MQQKVLLKQAIAKPSMSMHGCMFEIG